MLFRVFLILVVLVLALVLTGHEDFVGVLAHGGWVIVQGMSYAIGFGILLVVILVVAAAC